MKRLFLLFALFILIVMVACKQNVPSDDSGFLQENPVLPQENIEDEKPEYLFEEFVCAEERAFFDSGKEIGYYSYSLPLMSIGNESKLPEEERAAILRGMETFNTRMREILEEYVRYGDELLEGQKLYTEEENVDFVVCDEMTSVVYQQGQIISVVSHCYYYGGGAHPNSYVMTHIFDLSAGQFIDPAQIGDDPESFRVAAAERLIKHAESLGEDYTEGFWADYRDIISRWNETAVFFDEVGMQVVFSAYELGPYAMGPVELTLTYAELADVMGEGGLAHLGVL